MSYVDALLDRERNTIYVVERSAKGERQFVEHPTRYVVYWPSERGKYTSIFGTKLEKFQTAKDKEFKRELGVLPKGKLHENDINPIFRCLYLLVERQTHSVKLNFDKIHLSRFEIIHMGFNRFIPFFIEVHKKTCGYIIGFRSFLEHVFH